MNRFLIIGLLLLSLMACQRSKQKVVFVKEPMLMPTNNYFKETFDDAFFGEAHFNYTSTLTDDSIKNFYSSEIIIIEDTTKQFLRNCSATLVGDSLLLQFTDVPFYSSRYTLQILKTNNKIIPELYESAVPTDTSYKPPTFKIVDKYVYLDKQEYKKEDSLKAKIVIRVFVMRNPEAYNYKPQDTVSIYGLIKTIVE